MNRVAETVRLSWAHKMGILGSGIGIAVLDTGVSMHPDLIVRQNRIAAFYDPIGHREEPYDDNGHGTHVSGIIAGDGYASGGNYTGMAPKSHIIGIHVLDRFGNGNISDVLIGLKWVIENKDVYGIRVLNISVGCSSPACRKLDEDSTLVRAVNEVWDAGIVVVAAAGNEGPGPMSITVPGISRKIITVGAMDDGIETDVGGVRKKDYSGRGPTGACIKKPDIVTPGSNIVSCSLVRTRYPQRYIKNAGGQTWYTTKSGTSMATPVVSGAIALLLSAFPNMTAREVKIRLKNSAVDLGQCHEKQGWGMLDVQRLITG